MNVPNCVVYTPLEGGLYEVKRTFRNRPAAALAVRLLEQITEAAFEPLPKPVGVVIPQEVGCFLAALDRAEADDPAPHDGRPGEAAELPALEYPANEE